MDDNRQERPYVQIDLFEVKQEWEYYKFLKEKEKLEKEETQSIIIIDI